MKRAHDNDEDAAEQAPPPAQRARPSSASSSSEPPLCLHFDVNETIVLGDDAGGDSYEDSLHKILAKVAFVRPRAAGSDGDGGRWVEWSWHDGSPLDPECRAPDAPTPPLLPDAFEDPPGCVRFYNVPALKKPFAKCFAAPGSPGHGQFREMAGVRDCVQHAGCAVVLMAWWYAPKADWYGVLWVGSHSAWVCWATLQRVATAERAS